MNHKKNTKGVSLPLIIGLVTLLLVASMAINELIIRNMRSVQRIEASNKAYMAAEAGIEDALYELTPHFAGYEATGRGTNFGTNWENKWNIESIDDKDTFNGNIYKNKKLIIALFLDNNRSTEPKKINTGSASIETLNPSDFEITFTIPKSITITNALQIDNDQDGSLNEDPVNKKDVDGDGQIDEDSDEDPVILWKLTDGGSRTLMPIKGCLSGTEGGSEICEKNFKSSDQSVKLQATDKGQDTAGNKITIKEFINTTTSGTKLHFEFLIVAPMEHVDDIALGDKNIIPYIEYTVKSAEKQIPYPKFIIQSDGYYRKFKQTIIATLTPKMTVPLFDFTIIQQD